MKKGLVLEGGALRGLYSVGVIDVMLREGITFDGLVGVSAGACFGCNFKSQQIGRALRYNLRFADDPRYMGLRSLLKTGDLVGGEFAYHVMPKTLDVFDIEAYERNPMEFHMVTTNVATGQPEYRCFPKVTHDTLEWMRASASMPLVSKPVCVDGEFYLDGGISDSIPLKYFQSIGFERNVVVLTRPDGYRKTPMKMQSLVKFLLRKTPAIYDAMRRRHDVYNAQIEYLHSQIKAGNTFGIFPETDLPIGRTEMNRVKMRTVYNIGYDQCEKLIDDIKHFLNC